MIFIYATRMCKRVIPTGIFFFLFFQILTFGIIREDGKRAKNDPK